MEDCTVRCYCWFLRSKTDIINKIVIIILENLSNSGSNCQNYRPRSQFPPQKVFDRTKVCQMLIHTHITYTIVCERCGKSKLQFLSNALEDK